MWYIVVGIQMDEQPDIYFRTGALGRRAAIVGTRLDVWQITQTVRDHDNSVEETADYLGLPAAKVRSALRYYAANRDELDDIAEREASVAKRAEAT